MLTTSSPCVFALYFHQPRMVGGFECNCLYRMPFAFVVRGCVCLDKVGKHPVPCSMTVASIIRDFYQFVEEVIPSAVTGRLVDRDTVQLAPCCCYGHRLLVLGAEDVIDIARLRRRFDWTCCWFFFVGRACPPFFTRGRRFRFVSASRVAKPPVRSREFNRLFPHL